MNQNINKILTQMKTSEVLTLWYWDWFSRKKIKRWFELVDKGYSGHFAFERTKSEYERV